MRDALLFLVLFLSIHSTFDNFRTCQIYSHILDANDWWYDVKGCQVKLGDEWKIAMSALRERHANK